MGDIPEAEAADQVAPDDLCAPSRGMLRRENRNLVTDLCVRQRPGCGLILVN